MATRMTSPLAGFGWLRNAVNVGARKPGTLVLAAFLFFLVCMIPSLITVPIQLGMPGDMTAFLGAMLIAMIAGLALSPVFAGFLQVIDAIERGQPARARDIFGGYRNGVAKPAILFSLLMLVVYFSVFVVGLFAAGPGIRDGYLNLLSAGATSTPPAMDPEAMEGGGVLRLIGVIFALMVPVAGMWAIGFGQIAIGRRGVREAITDGATGALKNLLPMVILAIALIIGGFLLMLLFGIVIAALTAIANFVHEYLAFALLVPLYLAFVMGLYAVMFALAYFFWRDVCGVNVTPDVAHAEA